MRFDEKKQRILKILVLVKIWSFFKKKHKKMRIFATFFFDPTLFSARNRQTAKKKSHRPSQMTKMLAKKFLVILEQKLTKKIHNLEPPYRPL